MKRLLIAAIALSLAEVRLRSPTGPRWRPARQSQQPQGERHDNGNAVRYDNRDNHAGRHDNGQHRGQYRSGPAASAAGRIPHPGYYVDYRSHHLRAPPRGYQWVRVDNDYMMIALATGLIASIIIASH
jgi:Ni/Co efflux regulator RcnB